MEDQLAQNKTLLHLPSTDKIDMILSTLDLSEQMKKEYQEANERDKKLMFRFFVYGILFMFGSMVMSLWALGFCDILFYLKFIGGILFSLGFAFALGKFKEIIPAILKDPTKIQEQIKNLVKKI